jgi:hypothetical protein
MRAFRSSVRKASSDSAHKLSSSNDVAPCTYLAAAGHLNIFVCQHKLANLLLRKYQRTQIRRNACEFATNYMTPASESLNRAVRSSCAAMKETTLQESTAVLVVIQ